MSYFPEPFTGSSLIELRSFLENELRKIANELNDPIALELRQTTKEPEKPRNGMIVSADGVTFNPGAGEGAYERRGGVWVKL